MRRALGLGLDARAVAGRLAAEPAWFWLDGSGAPQGETRVSYLGVAAETAFARPGEERAFLSRIASARQTNEEAAEAEAGAPEPRPGGGAARGIGFAGGWVAALGYEFGVALLGAEADARPSGTDPDPTGFALRADVVLVIDHDSGEAELRGADERSLDAWLERYDPASCPQESSTAGPQPVAHPAPRWRSSDEEYLAGIEACLHAIRDGEAYVLCLTDTVEVDLEATPDSTPLAVFDRLRERGPALRSGLLVAGPLALVSASPERFLSVRGPFVRTDPIKGTRPRGADQETDAALARELAEDPKERSENLMIVDLMRNDLSSVCVPESVSVDGFLRVETHPHVHQLVSTVRGRLRAGLGAADAVAACFPGGSMTGAPKRRAVELLRGIEPGQRGLYSGCFGWFDRTGDAELAMTIRSVELHGLRARVGAGGGITADSAPLRELEEKGLKAGALLAALRGAGA